jgi:hypothetical protein
MKPMYRAADDPALFVSALILEGSNQWDTKKVQWIFYPFEAQRS